MNTLKAADKANDTKSIDAGKSLLTILNVMRCFSRLLFLSVPMDKIKTVVPTVLPAIVPTVVSKFTPPVMPANFYHHAPPAFTGLPVHQYTDQSQYYLPSDMQKPDRKESKMSASNKIEEYNNKYYRIRQDENLVLDGSTGLSKTFSKTNVHITKPPPPPMPFEKKKLNAFMKNDLNKGKIYFPPKSCDPDSDYFVNDRTYNCTCTVNSQYNDYCAYANIVPADDELNETCWLPIGFADDFDFCVQLKILNKYKNSAIPLRLIYHRDELFLDLGCTRFKYKKYSFFFELDSCQREIEPNAELRPGQKFDPDFQSSGTYKPLRLKMPRKFF